MLILCNHHIRTGLSPLGHARLWAMERLMYVNCATDDFRWAMLALALRAFSLLLAFAQHLLGSWIRRLAGRLALARLSAGTTDADTMVAAGGG
jgi:hypothetical protein